MRRGLRILLLASLVASVLSAAPPASAKAEGGASDAVVVAVIDFTFNAYHWDFLGSKMPQNQDGVKSNDLPLNQSPDRWLPGFPDPKKAFAGFEKLSLSLETKDPNVPVMALSARDQATWGGIKPSSAQAVNYYWVPGTKIIGAIDFGGNQILGAPGAHGTGTSSSSVGNLHGTCPECLLLFIDINSAADAEAAIEWAMDQPWIDVITNSYGFSRVSRDRLYSGSNTEAQRAASERGQTIFFSAGNGQANTFTAPNTTLLSSQEGPDWIVTVGAVSPGEDNYYGSGTGQTSHHASYTGHGKPADIAGIGSNYPTAYGATQVGATGGSGFGGTSNATPMVAGIYARSLYLARSDLKGPSRIQKNGVVAKGKRFKCGSTRRRCELADGVLTVEELRTRFFHGAIHTPAGMTTAQGAGEAPPIGEDEFLNEGHGTFVGRESGDAEAWYSEFEQILGPLEGRAPAIERPEGELEWMIVDSYCRQHIWGSWGSGYYVEGQTDLPGADPNYPMRSSIEQSCPTLRPPP